MTKYLLTRYCFDESSFFAFESEKSTEELNKELPLKPGTLEEIEFFSFHGFELENHQFYSYSVISLDDFWTQYNAKNHWINKNMTFKLKLFLGGTCNNSLWREDLIPLLNPNIEAFNPVVKDWTPECQAAEIKAREESDFVLYVITPRLLGFFSIAEVTEDSIKRPEKTLFCYLDKDGIFEFNIHQIKSLKLISSLVERNGAHIFSSLADVAEFLNKQ